MATTDAKESTSSSDSSGERKALLADSTVVKLDDNSDIDDDMNIVVIGQKLYTNSDVLGTTWMPLKGIFEDFSRFHVYWTDITDGLGRQQIASIFYIFFACITPAIAFGGLMGEVTHKAIGTIEMLLATTVVGVFMALFSTQPLTIYGGTGPLLLFTQVLYQLCETLDVDFLPAYAWTGLWTGIFCVILGVTNASNLIKYFTRFTDEIFAALISIIFIYEACSALYKGFKEKPVEGGVDINAKAFLSLILAVVTYFLIVFLKEFKKSPYLMPLFRSVISDFAPVIALILLTVADYVFRDIETNKLQIPETFETTSGRPWLIDIFKIEKWVIFATILPALLATLLVYLDQNITARIVNAGKHKLRKRPGFHWDLVLVGIAIGVVSIFGLPWLVAATVRALSNVYALAVYKEEKPGRQREIKYIHENRVSEVVIHIFIGASLLLTMVMKLIPMPVLYGIFLFMGFSSIEGNQFFDRMKLLFVWSQDGYPDTPYIRYVSLWKVHAFTIFQLCCFGLLWAVKTTILAISFPVFIVILAPIRTFILPCFWSKNDLEFLDMEDDENASNHKKNDDEDDEDDDDTDIYVSSKGMTDMDDSMVVSRDDSVTTQRVY